MGTKPHDLRFYLLRCFSLQPFTDLDAASGGGEAAAAGLSEGDVHEVADFFHGVDDLVGRDHTLDSGERHVSSGHRVHGADDVALHTRYFDETGDRIADEAEQIFQAHGDGGEDLFAAAAAQVDECACRHRGGGADLCLTATGGSGDAGAGGDDLTDSGSDEECADRIRIFTEERNEHGREDAAGSGGRSGDDPLHAGVGFAHLERLRDDTSHCVSAQGITLGDIVSHDATCTADQSAVGLAGCVVGITGLAHAFPHGGHLADRCLAVDEPVFHIFPEHRLREVDGFFLTDRKDLR